MGINITVIGGASSYTPELIATVSDFRKQVSVDRVTLTDPNVEKLNFISKVSLELLEKSNLGFDLHATPSLEEAITDADFIIMQIRVGGLAARIRDETLPMEFGLVGNETTGAGGFVCALRTIPAALAVAKEIERFSPKAWLLNLSNPAGIVTEALLKYSAVRTLGFCNIPINTTYALAAVLGIDPEKIQLDSFGLNHLSWTRGVYCDGKELLQPLLDEATSKEAIVYKRGLVEEMLEPEWLQAISMLPGWYLRYFYYPERILEIDRKKDISRGGEDIQAEKELHDIYSTVGYGSDAQRILKRKGGAQYYLPVLQVIDSITNDRGDVVVVDTANGKAMPDLPSEVCVEIPARVYKDRVESLPVGSMPRSVRGLVQAVKAYEELTIEAAVHGDPSSARAALATNPLIGSYSKAEAFLERVLENEVDYIADFNFENVDAVRQGQQNH